MFCNVDPGNRVCYSHERIQPCIYGLAGPDLPPNQPFGLTQNLPVGDLAAQRSLSDQGFNGLPIGKSNSLMIPPYKVSRTPAIDGLATRAGPASEKQQGTKSRLLRRCRELYGYLRLASGGSDDRRWLRRRRGTGGQMRFWRPSRAISAPPTGQGGEGSRSPVK